MTSPTEYTQYTGTQQHIYTRTDPRFIVLTRVLPAGDECGGVFYKIRCYTQLKRKDTV